VSGVWRATSPELDTSPPRDPDLPATVYVVCSTPRSGSGLLCRGLAATGLAGTPAEYFNSNQRAPLSARWRAGEDLCAYVRALRAHRTSPAGVLGVKIHSDQLEHLSCELGEPDPGELLPRLFPDALYVHLEREDVDRQAVSLWSALQTGIWSEQASMPPGVPADVPYSFEEHRRVPRADRPR
jgi:trehalose 2-sulfotransferase